MIDLFAKNTFREIRGLRALGVTGVTMTVWQGLRIHDSVPGGECRPSQEGLARNLGVEYRAVRRAIAKLRELGLVREVGRKHRVVVWELALDRVLEAANTETYQGKTTLIETNPSGQNDPDTTSVPGQNDPDTSDLSGQNDPDRKPDPGKTTLTREAVTGQNDPDRNRNRAKRPSLPGQNDPPNRTRREFVNSTQLHNSNCHKEPTVDQRVTTPAGAGVDSPEGEVFREALDCLLRQPWWMPTAAKEKRLASTETLLREYQRRWPVRSALLWIAIATHPKSKGVRTGSEGAFVYAHLRGYGRQGWNPESKSAKERTLHVAVLCCDEVATFAALGLESSYAPQNRATAWKQSESQGEPSPASSAESTGGSASLDRAADEATSCLGDIPGWMLNVPGQDRFEQQRNRLHATRALAGRLTVRCMVADVAHVLLALFRSETKELQDRRVTAAWVQQALEAEAIGKAPPALPGLPEAFWSHVLAGDYKQAFMFLTQQPASKVAME